MLRLVPFYFSPSIIRMIKSMRLRLAGHGARMGDKGNAYRILVGKPQGKKPRRRWMENIKMDIRETRRGCMDSIDLAQDRDQRRVFMNMVMNVGVP
jgi:hypothetical protein